MTAVLLVCLGNICRSPIAGGALRHAAEQAGLDLVIDSAGCGAWHAGEAPDRRSVMVAERHGVFIHDHEARQVTLADFDRFDLILGLDRDNVRHLERMRPNGARARVALFLKEALGVDKDVPDPYYGGMADFEAVFALCEKAGTALIKTLASARTA